MPQRGEHRCPSAWPRYGQRTRRPALRWLSRPGGRGQGAAGRTRCSQAQDPYGAGNAKLAAMTVAGSGWVRPGDVRHGKVVAVTMAGARAVR